MKDARDKLEYEVRIEDFAPELDFWNDDDVAFIKSDCTDGENKWIIYSADGTPIGSTDSREYAFIVAKQNEYKACSVH